jgi:hexokinase
MSLLTPGFSFSYPMKQLNLTTANLIAWNKSITCSGAVGHNVVDFLTEALKRRSLHVKVTAICNDTTATLIAGTVLEQDCGIGLIIGTGTNACYSELVQSVEKFAGDPKAKEVYDRRVPSLHTMCSDPRILYTRFLSDLVKVSLPVSDGEFVQLF